ncbi:hypothetical protein QWZ10_06865 [Paracoccus cavernae]|uniref:Tetratricopeptide repeat protein n=1 Tax=Paracoccus cavernae TaxID=1571207 RepID=A0ABT8D712_9RHOB|nr:hypothetical protein [Paracoccus cavernae]
MLGERDKRYQLRYISELHAGMRVNEEHLAERNFVIVDRFFKNDFVQANLLPASDSLRTIFAPFMFHSTAKCVSGRENAAQIFHAALEGDHAAIKAAIRRKRVTAFERAVNIAKTCNRKHRPLLAEKIVERLKETHPVDYALVTADAMRRSGRSNEARELYLGIIERDKGHKLAKQHLSALNTNCEFDVQK